MVNHIYEKYKILNILIKEGKKTNGICSYYINQKCFDFLGGYVKFCLKKLGIMKTVFIIHSLARNVYRKTGNHDTSFPIQLSVRNEYIKDATLKVTGR